MNCKAYREMLHSYANNELNEIEKSLISEHLANCPECSHELTEIRSLKQVFGSMKLEGVRLDGMKDSIMSLIQAGRKKVPAYDVKVLARLGTSMIACGLIALILNFTSLGESLTRQALPITEALDNSMRKVNQPFAFIDKGMTGMSNFMFDINGMIFKFEEKIKGGM